MPRRARIVVPGLPHHVTQRGNYKQDVFEWEKDYRRYAYLYRENARKYKVKTLAYCLMTNHVHLIVVPETEDGLARLFRNTHMCYSQYFNRKNNKKGHLWQSRFFSCVLSSAHFYRAVRYVEKNPVRAGMVLKPWEYVWSSAKQHVGMDTCPIIEIENKDQILEMSEQSVGWQEYLGEDDKAGEEGIRDATQRGTAWGPDEFILGLEKRMNRVLRKQKAGRL